jgi:hypothetical protein
MAKNKNAVKPAEQPIEEQARQQTGQQQIRMRIDETDMKTAYANGVRTNGTAEEVILDFGLNLFLPTAQQPGEAEAPADPQQQAEILFKVTERVVMNYYSAKRLAVTLSQLIRRHEEQFGELEMDVTKRQQTGAS